MIRIPNEDRDIIEQAMYLPMFLTVLEKDRNIIDKAPFILKEPYLNLVEETIRAVQKDLKVVKDKMRQKNMKVQQIGHDEAFTMYSFLYEGFEEQHNYFNPMIRNKVHELMEHYLYNRFK
ncbi:hypothetical protein [Cytobacillus solani]|uniref:YhjD n=1 Tax=Cytobacillus solani TaxID=1637975 RepID=A0A0Q3VG34_9BACI|nr:hypothetical protein [Cytobacillus solani]KQL19098.1 hypothetical protein AN957_11235 [Cytobacillus solani]